MSRSTIGPVFRGLPAPRSILQIVISIAQVQLLIPAIDDDHHELILIKAEMPQGFLIEIMST
ncbi:hypothetical protein NKJ90_16740 [Mesorhizobium sp. M0051]|uniref:hypothetical protein n=1 Tax=unclassified Mesorhizobium TaxID=325217 RepID=UPI0004CE12B6|nr:hypothetical protein [Mesorhizobium sp. LNHC252B00]